MPHLRIAAALASAVAASVIAPAAAHAADLTNLPACASSLTAPQSTATLAARVGKAGAVTVFVEGTAQQSHPTSYTIDFGDGVVDTGSSSTVNHTYPTSGLWAPTVIVTDASGATSTSPACSIQAPTAPEVPPNSVTRLAGSSRYETSAAVSHSLWADVKSGQYVPDPVRRQAKAVVLASGENFPDALAGVPLAAYKQGPLILTTKDSLHTAAEQEVKRLLPAGATVYVLGGPAALSPTVEDQLHADGYQTVRYGGQDRFGTAMQIATQGLGNPANVLVVTGSDFPDALAAGPVATSTKYTADGKPAAIVLTNGDKVSDPATAAFIRARFGYTPPSSTQTNYGPDSPVLAVGGSALHALAEMSGVGDLWPEANNCSGATIKFQIAAGEDRYSTAACLFGWGTRLENVGSAYNGDTPENIGLANGTTFADALSGAAALATTGGSILLTAPDSLPEPTESAFDSNRRNHLNAGPGAIFPTIAVDIFGGPEAISPAIEAQIRRLIP